MLTKFKQSIITTVENIFGIIFHLNTFCAISLWKECQKDFFCDLINKSYNNRIQISFWNLTAGSLLWILQIIIYVSTCLCETQYFFANEIMHGIYFLCIDTKCFEYNKLHWWLFLRLWLTCKYCIFYLSWNLKDKARVNNCDMISFVL